MQPSEIVSLYEENRHFYPECCFKGVSPQRVQGLMDVILKFDLILLDAYGVITDGEGVIPEALIAVKKAKELGKDVRVVSNNAANSGASLVKKYADMGFPFKDGEVVSSHDVVQSFAAELVGTAGLSMVANTNTPLKGFKNVRDTGGEIPKHTQGLLFFNGASYEDELMNTLIKSGKGNQYSIAVGNPDIVAQNGANIVRTPGYYMAEFMRETKQEDLPILLGKPANVIFETVMANEIADPENVLMVGDTLHTDILGGRAMGFKTMLLESGVLGEEAEPLARKTGILPDYIAPTL